MRSVSLVSVLALLAAAPALAESGIAPPVRAQSAAHPTYTAAQFYETTTVTMVPSSGRAYAPDSGSILIGSDQTGVFNAYALPLGSGAPAPLTASTTSSIFPISYVPGSGRILFSQDGGGDELTHIFVREEDGSVRDLTPGENLKADFLGWKDDGTVFYVMSNGRDPAAFDVHAIDATTYESRMVFQNPGFIPSGLSNDGRWLSLDKPITSANSDIYVVDLEAGGEPALVTPHDGDVAHSTYGFTADSRALDYGTDEHGEFTQAWTHDLSTSEKSVLITADWDVQFVIFSPTGRYRVSALNADALSDVTFLDTSTGQAVALTGVPEGSLGQVRFSPDERTVSFRVSSDTSPGDVFTADLSTGAARRLTNSLNPAIDEAQLVEATIVRYRAEGGIDIPAVLYRPRGASASNPAPAIVMAHGGPGGQITRGYDPEVQHLVNHGYAVLGVNNRGSSGYGKSFFHMDDRRHGEADLRDIVAAGQWLRDQDWVADDKVAVMGGSYGGYLTAAALAFHPTAFEAGINIFGVTNWVRTLESIPAWWGAQREALFDEMGDPATDAERHRRISPLFHADRIQRPMLVVQGANDPRVLQVESDELVAAVRANDVPVEYVLFPNEGHGFQRRDNRITAQEAYLTFLEQYVRKAD